MDATVARDWMALEPPPAAPASSRPGALRDVDGRPLHGFWCAAEGVTALVVAANHGWPLACWRVPGGRAAEAWRARSPLLRVSNALLPTRPWLWQLERRLVLSSPPDAAVGLVLAGRKPAARAATADPGRARRWVEAAADAGVAVRHDLRAAQPQDGRVLHTVAVARTERFGQLFDLDGLLSDLAACSVTGTALDAAAVELALLAGLHVADLLELDGWAGGLSAVRGRGAGGAAACRAGVPGRAGGTSGSGAVAVGVWGRDAAATVRTGLALGYHPALVAGALLGLGVDPDHPIAALALRATPPTGSSRRARTAPLPGLRGFGAGAPGVATAVGWVGAE